MFGKFNPIYIVILIVLFTSCNKAPYTNKAADAWYNQLPACPCMNPDLNGVKLNDGWAQDKADLNKYHKGAKASFRSYPSVATSQGHSCQQCCYDSAGRLITEGSGAGTPDKVSTCRGEDANGKMKVKYFSLLGHYFKDVRPWEQYGGEDSGWKKYNLLWVPNKGKACN